MEDVLAKGSKQVVQVADKREILEDKRVVIEVVKTKEKCAAINRQPDADDDQVGFETQQKRFFGSSRQSGLWHVSVAV